MKLRLRVWLSLGLMASVAVFCGCQGNSTATPNGATGEDEHDHGHHHGHGHEDEEVGPNGGHVVQFNGDKYAAEWLHDDETNTVTVHILDSTGEQVLPVPVEQVHIDVIVTPDQSAYVLEAVSQEGDPEGEHSMFQVSDELLITALKMEEGVHNTLRLEVDGEIFTAPIVHHAHDHHHGHSH